MLIGNTTNDLEMGEPNHFPLASSIREMAFLNRLCARVDAGEGRERHESSL